MASSASHKATENSPHQLQEEANSQSLLGPAALVEHKAGGAAMALCCGAMGWLAMAQGMK